MNPIILDKDEFTIIGVRAILELGVTDTDSLWKNQFLPRKDELAVSSPGLYGVFNSLPGEDTSLRIEYVAGAAVDSLDNIPVGMVGWIIPGGRYAEVEAEGARVADVCRSLIADWLPDSGFRMTGTPLFAYTESSHPDDPAASWRVYLPIGTQEELSEFASWLGNSKTEIIYPS